MLGLLNHDTYLRDNLAQLEMDIAVRCLPEARIILELTGATRLWRMLFSSYTMLWLRLRACRCSPNHLLLFKRRLINVRRVVAAWKATVQLGTAVVPFHARHLDGAVVIADMSLRWAAIAARKSSHAQ